MRTMYSLSPIITDCVKEWTTLEIWWRNMVNVLWKLCFANNFSDDKRRDSVHSKRLVWTRLSKALGCLYCTVIENKVQEELYRGQSLISDATLERRIFWAFSYTQRDAIWPLERAILIILISQRKNSSSVVVVTNPASCLRVPGLHYWLYPGNYTYYSKWSVWARARKDKWGESGRKSNKILAEIVGNGWDQPIRRRVKITKSRKRK